MTFTAQEKEAWVKWLERYGARPFLESFLRTSHGAKSKCVFCGNPIYLDLLEGGGVADWKTEDGDYGCNRNPESDAEGVASHRAEGVA